jgi:uncharacterized membrane protein
MDRVIAIALPLVFGLLSSGLVYFLVVQRGAYFLRFCVPNRWINTMIDFVFGGLTLMALLIYAALNIGKYESYNLYPMDFALFDQVIWNTLHGRILENTIFADAPILLAQRFSPILVAFVPLYALSNDLHIFVVTPAVAITAAAFPLYWFARRRMGRSLALAIGFAFLIAPGVQFIALDQFKEIMLTLPFLVLAAVFLIERKYLPFFGSLALALLCKEEVGFIAAAFGVYIFLAQRRYLLGGALAVFGIAWVIFLIQTLIPYFGGGSTYYYFGGSFYGTGLYDYLGSNVFEILITLLTRPDTVLQNLLTAERIDAVVKMFLPLGIVAVFGSEVVLLALPTLGYTLLSQRQLQYLFGSYHYAPVYAFLFVGLVIGLERILRWAQARFDISVTQNAALRAACGTFILVSSVSTYYLNAVGPGSRNFTSSLYTPTARHWLGTELARRIPSGATVAAQTELVARLGHRRYLYLDTTQPCLSAMDYIFADTQQAWYTHRQIGWQAILDSGWFEPLFEGDGYILRKRVSARPLDALIVRFGNHLSLVGYSILPTGTVTGGQGLTVITGWQTMLKLSERYVLHYSLYDNQGHLWVYNAFEPCRGISPTDGWLPGQPHYDDTLLRLPPTMPTGIYDVMLSVSTPSEDFIKAWDASGQQLGAEIKLASLRVEKNKQSFSASELWIEHKYFVDMGEMRLLGFKPIPSEIRAGQVLSIGLYWRARSKPQGDYQISVQLRDANGRVVIEHSARPANDTYPTTAWNTGEVLLAWHDLPLPREMAADVYQIVVILRDTDTTRTLGETRLREIKVLQ